MMRKKYLSVLFLVAVAGCKGRSEVKSDIKADLQVLLDRQKGSEDAIEALGKNIEASRQETQAKLKLLNKEAEKEREAAVERDRLNKELTKTVESLRGEMATGKQMAALREGLRKDLKEDARNTVWEEFKKRLARIKKEEVAKKPLLPKRAPAKIVAPPKPKEPKGGLRFPVNPWPPLVKEAKQWSRKVDEEQRELVKKAGSARKKVQETLAEFQMLIAGLVQQSGQYRRQAEAQEREFKKALKKLDSLHPDTELLEKMNRLTVMLIRVWQENQRDKDLWGPAAYPRSVLRMQQLFTWYQWQLNPMGPEPPEPWVPIPSVPKLRPISICP